MNDTALVTTKTLESSLVRDMATSYGMDPAKFYATVVATLFPSGQDKKPPTPEQVAMFLIVANKYRLNPFVKEIYAFPSKGGGIIPVVSIDGWITTVMRSPEYDGHEFQEHYDAEGKLSAVTCMMRRKDRNHPISMTEFMAECKRNTDPWTQWPYRMLHHKAYIQAARYAFGLSGIYDQDEAERVQSVELAVDERRPAVSQPTRMSEQRQESLPPYQPQQSIPSRTEVAQSQPEAVRATNGSVPQQPKDLTMDAPSVDDLLNAKEREQVTQAGYSVGWTLMELKTYIKINYGVAAIGELRRSQLPQVLEEIKAGGRR